MNLQYVLLSVNLQVCNKNECGKLSTYVLVGEQFEGFFCEEHGIEIQKKLQLKWEFNNENKTIKKSKRGRPKKLKFNKKLPSLSKKECLYCKKEFIGRSNKKFCSDVCRLNHWEIDHPRKETIKVERVCYCGNTFVGLLNQKFCCKDCSTNFWKEKSRKSYEDKKKINKPKTMEELLKLVGAK